MLTKLLSSEKLEKNWLILLKNLFFEILNKEIITGFLDLPLLIFGGRFF